MSIRPSYMRGLKTLFPAFLFLIILQLSCKKWDTSIPQESNIERFLKLPSNADPVIKRIVADMRAHEAKKPFIENLL